MDSIIFEADYTMRHQNESKKIYICLSNFRFRRLNFLKSKMGIYAYLLTTFIDSFDYETRLYS